MGSGVQAGEVKKRNKTLKNYEIMLTFSEDKKTKVYGTLNRVQQSFFLKSLMLKHSKCCGNILATEEISAGGVESLNEEATKKFIKITDKKPKNYEI
jgi:hypothetical protein